MTDRPFRFGVTNGGASDMVSWTASRPARRIARLRHLPDAGHGSTPAPLPPRPQRRARSTSGRGCCAAHGPRARLTRRRWRGHRRHRNPARVDGLHRHGAHFEPAGTCTPSTPTPKPSRHAHSLATQSAEPQSASGRPALRAQRERRSASSRSRATTTHNVTNPSAPNRASHVRKSAYPNTSVITTP